MANMSYCRFENTLSDLRDCYEDLQSRGRLCGLNEYGEVLSRSEFEAAVELINLMTEFSDEFGDFDYGQERDRWKEVRDAK